MAGQTEHEMNERPGPARLAVLAAALLAGCAAYRLPEPAAVSPETGARPSAEAPRPATAPRPAPGERIVAVATAKIGAPYRYGARGPDAFDCSGLVHYAYAAAGLPVPRTAAAQHRAARAVPIDQARRGDLLFFRDGGRISHVGIYLGGRRFVHAPASGQPVTISRLDEAWYREHFAGAGRLFQKTVSETITGTSENRLRH